MIIETENQLRLAMLADSEDEHLEFKSAKNSYDRHKLFEYCCALSNEGGGHLILGVTDKKPRNICGTMAFPNLQQLKTDIYNKLRRRVEIVELKTADGRVLVCRVPPSHAGSLTDVDGRFLMRIGEELKPMTGDLLREKMLRDRGDLSSDIVSGASFNSLDQHLIKTFRKLASNKARKRGDEYGIEQADRIDTMSDNEILEVTNLINDGYITNAALILLGSEAALAKYLPQAEIIFEYRSTDASIDYQEREIYRRGLLGVIDTIWRDINKRNEVQSFQFGLIRQQIRTFAERSVREAFLNAVCHRSYDDQGSVRLLQFPRRLEVISPGSFPPGVSPENILSVSKPRNRRLHEALERCGLVERSSQGADLMFREALSAGKPQPSFAGSDAYTVHVTLDGQVRDEKLLAYLEKIGHDKLRTLDVVDLIAIDAVYSSRAPNQSQIQRMPKLLEMGLIEKTGRNKWILSRGLYAAIGKTGTYTRRRGLDHETEKELLLKHLKESGKSGSPIGELLDVLPSRPRSQVRKRLAELRAEGRAVVVGQRALGRWFVKGKEPNQDKSL